jgi:hypothetical protein
LGAGFAPFISYYDGVTKYNMKDLPLNPTSPFEGPGGVRIADDLTQLFSGTLTNTLFAAGVCGSSADTFWTGTLSNGLMDDDFTCRIPGDDSWSDQDFFPGSIRYGGCNALTSFANIGSETSTDACAGATTRYILCYKNA